MGAKQSRKFYPGKNFTAIFEKLLPADNHNMDFIKIDEKLASNITVHVELIYDEKCIHLGSFEPGRPESLQVEPNNRDLSVLIKADTYCQAAQQICGEACSTALQPRSLLRYRAASGKILYSAGLFHTPLGRAIIKQALWVAGY